MSIDAQTKPARRILVVNDDPDTRQLIVDVLVNSDFEAHAAFDGADGWDSLRSKQFDLVITDNKMPRMTGVEMIEKLRSSRMTVPVIMATGTMPTFEFARKPWLTPDVTLTTPFSNDELLAAIRNILFKDNFDPDDIHQRGED